MIEFVDSSSELKVNYDNVAFKDTKETNNIAHYYDPLRVLDSDILWLKQHYKYKSDITKN